jgi:dTDP-4-amino-4,6-dideoxygalactose transaminase
MSEIKVPFQDFKAAYHELKAELDESYHRFMESGWYVLGKETTAFEEEYAAYCEAAQCVGVSNGLEALHLALRAMDVGPGDEVIVPSNTYIATWLAVSQAGATPVPVEPDPSTFNIDPARVEEAVTPRTKVILAVNLYGQPCDYDPLLAITHKHGLKLAIDNAQAQGARYKGRRVGGIADIECHSFYPSKNLGAYGEAGAVTTHDADLADRIRVLRNYGSRVRYHNEIPGYNSRIDELQAAFLRVKIRHLDEWNARRTAIAEHYISGLRPLASGLSLPIVPAWASPVWHLFVIRHPHRDRLQQHLAEQGIQTIIHYPIPPHLSGAYSDLRPPASGFWNLPIAETLANDILSLPIGPHMVPEAVSIVVDAIKSFPEL